MVVYLADLLSPATDALDALQWIWIGLSAVAARVALLQKNLPPVICA